MLDRKAPRQPPRYANDLTMQSRAAMQGGLEAALADLRLLDPEFTLEGFVQEAKSMFVKVKEAIWNPDPVALTMHLNQPALDKMIFQARRFAAAGMYLKVEGLEILEADVSTHPDNVEGIELGVKFHWKSRSEVTYDKRTDRPLQSLGGGHHREVWFFVRDPKATRTGTPDIKEKCPHCTAPLNLVNGYCKYCKNMVRSESGLWQVYKIAVVA